MDLQAALVFELVFLQRPAPGRDLRYLWTNTLTPCVVLFAPVVENYDLFKLISGAE